MNRQQTTLQDYSAQELDAMHQQLGGWDAVAAHLGVSGRTLSRYRAGLSAVEAPVEQVSAPATAVSTDLTDLVAQLAAAMSAQSAATQQLLLKISGNGAVVEPVRKPVTQKPVAAQRPAAQATKADVPVFDRLQAAKRRAAKHHPTDQKDLDSEYVGPLGDGRPYAGEIFGVSKKRRPRIGATPVTSPRTTLVIGDSHFHPAITPLTMRAMTLVSLHAAAIQPEHLVHIGDGGDWSSVCRHVRNDTWKAREKPSLRQDLDCFRENWIQLNRALDEHGVAVGKRNYCWGNHDAWLSTFEDDHPELKGLATGELSEILRDSGWSATDYGEYYFIGGVAYTHVPLNGMGRPVGGQTGENTVAMQSSRDTVFGHTHRYAMARRPRMDGVIGTTLNCGSSMPEYYVGEYAQLSQGRALDYGVLEVVDFDCRIQSHRFVTMRELEARYGADADRRLA
ncbi:hypothetical protein FHR90_003283 [Endobacter medicaginis]|uniref:Calcineurin-like phosphoesterase domain-containing protein n=1 Tax=Endobacter medicaginis TaxID=1181271 RepID=A0A839UYJ5_9PROT|nr:hypothetical protein [Endobacter medicaginis]MBB3175428.1 hypothetical protein [Endobacter medicaginis]MCX5477205.1 hypothetical protein [Endobacter medicaginis]NVN29614.1 hypothetical protein [Endobacter medicaginis]